MFIKQVDTRDARFQLEPGEGSDAVHSAPQYSFAVTQIALDNGLQGSGLVLTMGAGNDLVCSAIKLLAQPLVGLELEALMSKFGETFRTLADRSEEPHV